MSARHKVTLVYKTAEAARFAHARFVAERMGVKLPAGSITQSLNDAETVLMSKPARKGGAK